jgi:hypothetical protein
MVLPNSLSTIKERMAGITLWDSKQEQQKINPLSDNDKQLLQQTAQSAVNDILSQIQDPLDELGIEQQIASNYGVSSSIADLVV